MPYIKQTDRKTIDAYLESLGVPSEPGMLNYLTIAEIDGVLSNVASEFYRRVAVPYENAKMAENGDVYN